MTSGSVTEREAVEPVADVSAKAVDNQLIDELVHRAQASPATTTAATPHWADTRPSAV
ncbi:hypothetical protein ACIBBB_25725 [Streptomyces sp. NPDC051217]|uniref:hypothetical protein n=1 Tax=Streptomyces sp. NPDC051217 TaxID=3365644 RepID=UPI00379F6E87